MAFQGSDQFAISRSGTLYKVTGADVLAYVQSNVGTGEYVVSDIAARNALNASMSLGDRAIVNDATGDSTVATGWAIYVWMASNTWRKVAEQEGLDVTVATHDPVTLGGSASTNPLTLSGQVLNFSIANLSTAP